MKNRASDLWQIKNKTVTLGIEKKTGFIRAMVFRNKVDPFQHLPGGIPGYIGALRIYDERDRRWYNDAIDSFTVSKARKSGNTVSFAKQFRGAPFALKVKMALNAQGLSWEVQATKKNGKVADRTLHVHFQLPALAGWDVWAPCRAGHPKTFDGQTSFSFMYNQNSWVSENDVILPMMSHYNAEADVGFTMMNGLDDLVPASQLQFSNGDKCYFWNHYKKDLQYVPHLELVNYAIGLVGRRPMATRAVVLFHEGDWRPALGQVFKRWQGVFEPDNKKIFDYDGVFECASVTPRDLDAAKKEHMRLLENHDHFEYYSVYRNPKKKWFRNGVMERVWAALGGTKTRIVGKGNVQGGLDGRGTLEWMKTHSDREIAELVVGKTPAKNLPKGFPKSIRKWTDQQIDEFLYHTRDRIRKRLSDAAERDIHSFWYFNYSDGFRPVVEERWPDSIAEGEDGSKTPSGWQMCHTMNGDPKYSFGRALLAQARKIVEEYPELKGFFLDCFRHYEIDFAHDDGVTVVNNKPAYSMALSYLELDKRLKAILNKKKMCTFANKPQIIGIMRYVDGMMLEGSGDMFEEKYFWSGIAMPIIFLWTHTQASTDEMYRRSILYGCFPRRVPGESKLLNRYMPLYEEFRKRVLCFEADPIRGPKGSRTQLYTVGKDYLASVVNVDLEPDDTVSYGSTPHAILRVKRGHDVGKVGVMYPGDKRWRTVKASFNGTFIVVPLEKFNNCAIVKLFVTRKTGKRIGKEFFPKFIERCPDPVSAFDNLEQM